MDTIQLKNVQDHQDKFKRDLLATAGIDRNISAGPNGYRSAFFWQKMFKQCLKLGRAQEYRSLPLITMGLEIYEYSPKKIKHIYHRQWKCC
jgi:hypothetical protein